MKNILQKGILAIMAAFAVLLTITSAVSASTLWAPQPGLCYFLDTDGDCIAGPPDFDAIEGCIQERETVHIDGYSCRDLFELDGNGIVGPGDLSVFRNYQMALMHGTLSNLNIAVLPTMINVTIPENMTAGSTYVISAQAVSDETLWNTRLAMPGVGIIFRISDPEMAYLEGRNTEFGRGDEYINGSEVFEMTSPRSEGASAVIRIHIKKKGDFMIQAILPATPAKGFDSDLEAGSQEHVRNSMPRLEAMSAINVDEGDLVKVAPEATDADGDALTYTFSAPLDENGEWQTTDRDSGVYHTTVIVSDGEESATQYLRINVFGKRMPGIGACFFADSDGDCWISPPDLRAVQTCAKGMESVRIDGYSCKDLFDLNGDGFVDPGDVSIWRNMWHQIDVRQLSGAPSDMSITDMPAEVYAGEPFNLTVRVVGSGSYNNNNVKLPKAGIGVEFSVEEGSADLYGRNTAYGSWREYVTSSKVSELTSKTQIGYPEVGGFATIKVTPTAAGKLVIDMGVEGDPTKYTNEFHETVEFNVMERPAEPVNNAPVFDQMAAQKVNETENLTFTISAADADGDDVAYSAADIPAGAVMNGQLFSWTPNSTQSGNYTVIFTATDGNMSSEMNVSIEVLDRINQSEEDDDDQGEDDDSQGSDGQGSGSGPSGSGRRSSGPAAFAADSGQDTSAHDTGAGSGTPADGSDAEDGAEVQAQPGETATDEITGSAVGEREGRSYSAWMLALLGIILMAIIAFVSWKIATRAKPEGMTPPGKTA